MNWKEVLRDTWQEPWFKTLLDTVEEAEKHQPIYPPKADRFNALKHTPFDAVKAVILGQDPYHQPRQAMGLCFSVHKGVPIPPSLQNIYKELKSDIGVTLPSHGDLTAWAKAGVLLLNTTLTVEDSRPLSHKAFGWERFTDAVIAALNKKSTPVVFMLWGSHAQAKKHLIDNPNHHLLMAPHPSPLSAHRGFFGCRHFSKANAYLISQGIEPINFALTP